MMKYLLALTSLALLTSCATNVHPVATGGSKADGTIMLSYELGEFQKPVINWDEANLQAAERCRAWGYKSAKAFGGQQSHCVAYDGYGCVRTLVNIPYQCI